MDHQSSTNPQKSYCYLAFVPFILTAKVFMAEMAPVVVDQTYNYSEINSCLAQVVVLTSMEED